MNTVSLPTDFIERIIQKGDRIQAIRYIYEFHLVGKFPPVPILKDHISSKIVPVIFLDPVICFP